MATGFLAQRRRNQAAALRRLMAEQRDMAQRIGRLLQSSASERDGAGQAIIPNRQAKREALKLAIWLLFLKPYYWGRGDDPLRGSDPQSPYARTLYAGVAGAVEMEVKRQVSMIRRATTDAVILAWLLNDAPIRSEPPSLIYPTFAQWVDPSGFRLVDRVVRVGIDARARANRFIDYHVGRATPAATMANRLEQFMTTGETQRTPYGQHGSYAARRLLFTETVVAAGYAAVNASAVNPAVKGIRWKLNRGDTDIDQCDINSRSGPDGDGVYPAIDVPKYPDHPNEQCDLLPVPIDNPSAAMRQLHDGIVARTEQAIRLHGVFSPERLRDWLLGTEQRQRIHS